MPDVCGHNMHDISRLLERLPEKLEEGKPLRVQFGHGSRLRIDRQLPFLCVHRSRTTTDTGTARLLNSQSSVLIVAPEDNPRAVIEEIVKAHQPLFGAFFILEVWSHEAEDGHPPPEFHIHPGRDPNSMQLAEFLAQELRRLKLGEEAVVRISSERPRPEALSPLLSKVFREEQNVVLLGLDLAAFYQDADGQAYPDLLRTFRRAVDIRIRQLFFEFAQNFTTFQPSNFQVLGPRAMVCLLYTSPSPRDS